MATQENPFIIEVGTTAVEISKPGTRLSARIIRNLGTGSVFIGVSNAITATGDTMGWEVAAGKEFPDSISKNAIYAISASGTNDVQVWEVR